MKYFNNLFILSLFIFSSGIQSGEITVMTYNVYMLPYQSLAKHLEQLLRLMPDFGPLKALGKNAENLAKLQTQAKKRGREIPSKIAPLADVFAFEEGFDNSGRERLIRYMEKEGVKNKTKVLGRGALEYAKIIAFGGKKAIRLTNSGLLAMSKYPIVKTKGLYYQDKGIPAVADDAIADKGALYTRIKKDGKKYHIFSTHVQSRFRYPGAIEVREKQLKALKEFIDEQKIPATEPVIIVGDFNIDSANPETRKINYEHYPKMLKVLNATDVRPTGYQFTAIFDKENQKKFGSKGQRIDYVLYSNTHLKPTKATVTVQKQLGDLSDHFPVVGHFVFEGY